MRSQYLFIFSIGYQNSLVACEEALVYEKTMQLASFIKVYRGK